MQIDPQFRLTKFKHHPQYEGQTEHLQYRDLWNKAPQKGITTDYPLNIDVEVSRVCSLKCSFCPRYVVKDLDYKKGYFDFNLYKKIFDDPKCVPRAMKFNWLGEPLHHKELPEFIKLAKQKGVIETMINTNGVPLTRELSKKIIESGLDRIIFSIDTIDLEKYKKMRTGAELWLMVGNIQNLLQLKEGYQVHHPIIRIQKIDFPDTREEPFEEFWENMGVDEVSYISYKEKDKTKSDFEPKPCAQPFQRLLIDVYGKMHLCCADYENQYVVGNLKEGDTVHKAWHSEMANWLRRLSFDNRLGEIDVCKNCETTK